MSSAPERDRRAIDGYLAPALYDVQYSAYREDIPFWVELARAAAANLGMDYTRAKNYITRVVRYDLGRPELGGLDLFRRYLVRQGMVPQSSGFDLYTR